MAFKTWCLSVFAMGLTIVIPAFAQTPSATPLTIDQTAVSIRVDGHLEDWPSARMIFLGQPSQIITGKSYWKNQQDFSGRVFLTYDSQFLYAAAVVQKQGAILNDNESLSLWNGDCLELFLSVNPKSNGPRRLSSGDYLLGFSPGSGCKNPRMYCFNKNKEILGGRIIARPTKTGYVMEICVPLSFFEGLELGQGKTAALDLVLDEAGPISGNRIVQMDLSEKPLSRENPGTWTGIQWIGKAEVSVPMERVEDVNARMVQDGTKGANYMGVGNLQGQVVDPTGKALVGVKVSTWPKTKEAVTDKSGQFKIEKVKLYDKTLVCGRVDGFATSIAPTGRKGMPILVKLWPLPTGLAATSDATGSLRLGANVALGKNGTWDNSLDSTADQLKALKLGVLRLKGTDTVLQSSDSGHQALDQFVAFARKVGAEPMIEAPVSIPSANLASDWVKYCNAEKAYNVHYWTIGDEPDTQSRAEDYSIYDYINDYRTLYNAMKRTDPSIFIMGPELAAKYTEGEDDWLTPFVEYNGDILDMVSFHRFAALKAADLILKSLQADLRNDAPVFQNLLDKVSVSSDHFIPLVVTAEGLWREEANATLPGEKASADFWSALWMEEKLGLALKENLGMVLAAGVKAAQGTSLLSDIGPRPAYWALKLFSEFLGLKPVPVQFQQVDMTAYADQDPKTKDVQLLIINRTDRYYRPKIQLNGKDADLMVEAGLDLKVDYEIPSYSISMLKVKADNTPGEMTVYTYKTAQAGKEPVTSVLKPW